MSIPDLRPHPKLTAVPGPVLLVVMDGVGIGQHNSGDAVHLARTPSLDWLAKNCPSTTLSAHGKAVGLPSNKDMGNSEVGHNALGAGRIFDQGAKLVQEALQTGALFRGEVWKKMVARVNQSHEPLHFIGLLSDGNVHSHIDHLVAMIERADADGVQKVRVHALLDGRDVPSTSALQYVQQLEKILSAISAAADRDYRVASGGGRMKVTMDRYEADWPMVEQGWDLHVRGKGRTFPSLTIAIKTLRDESPGVSDQNLPGFVIADGALPVGPIRDGAAVVFFNFRGDRAIEISRAFEDESFDAFDRGEVPDILYAGMMQYDGDLRLPAQFLVTPPAIDHTMGEYLARAGCTQFAISETQKFGHVTYFWNGNRSGKFDDKSETYVEIKSDNVPFDERPWMKAGEITEKLIAALKTGDFRHARVNYANGDMVGHTGEIEPTILAVQTVDLQLARLMKVINKLDGALIVTADHGNADDMFLTNKKTGEFLRDADGPRPKTSHSLNAVPFHIYCPSQQLSLATVARPGLANVAATTMALLGYAAPDDYAQSLL